MIVPMPGMTIGRKVLTLALPCGIIADLLLQVTPWGLNLFLAVVLLIAAAALIARWNHIDLYGEVRCLALAMLFFGIALVWRDGPTLTTASALALVGAVTLAALTSRAGQLRLV